MYVKNSKEEETRFSNLEGGDCFKVKGIDILFMKLKDNKSYVGFDGEIYNDISDDTIVCKQIDAHVVY